MDIFTGDHPELQVLSLEGNRLEGLQLGVFNGLANLRMLRLVSNLFVSIPVAALRPLPSLSHLYLTNNLIQSLTQQDVLGLDRLHSFDVSYNRLVNIDVGIIQCLPKLTEFAIHGNYLECNCSLAWLRSYENCLCVFEHDKCSTPPSNRKYTIRTFPIEACSEGYEVNCPSEVQCKFVRPYGQPPPIFDMTDDPISFGFQDRSFGSPENATRPPLLKYTASNDEHAPDITTADDTAAGGLTVTNHSDVNFMGFDTAEIELLIRIALASVSCIFLVVVSLLILRRIFWKRTPIIPPHEAAAEALAETSQMYLPTSIEETSVGL